MFLKPVPSPYEDGLPKRAVFYRPNESQTFAIDAEALHKDPALLKVFGWWKPLAIRALDALAWTLVIAGVVGTIWFAWWMFLPCVIANVAMLLANRKAAGEIARSAAELSNQHFLYLHEQRALWLVPDRAPDRTLEQLAA
ncbi:MAG: hypothetical protein AAGJ29_04945 [Pseudomonadota bacterium]